MLQVFDLTDKVVVVTGASKGLGRAFCKALAESGAMVVGIARVEEELQSLKAELEEKNKKFDYFVSSITDEEAVAKIADECVARYGKIDALVNNAASGRVNVPFEDIEVSRWQQTMENNLTGSFICCKQFGRKMIEKKAGKIINIASMSGFIANKGVHCGPYEVSKLGMVALTKSLAGEWAKYNITSNALAPGYIATVRNSKFFDENPEFTKEALDMIPVGKMPIPDDLGGAMVFLCSDASWYMNGAVLMMDGGYTVW